MKIPILHRLLQKIALNIRRARARRFFMRRVAPAIDWAGMDQLKARFSDPAKFPEYHRPAGHYKYFQYDQYFVRNAERLLRLGLERGPRRRVLDLGCGFGYFLLCCQVAGHKAVGLDLSVEMYDAVLDVLGVEKVVHRIEPFEPLPVIEGGPFDVVTAHEINFDIVGKGGWNVAQWDWFLRDLSKQMAESSMLALKFNDKHGAAVLQGPVLAYFEQLGSAIDGRTAMIPQLKAKLAAIPAVEK